jgi:nucleoside-diphosphate-sugar epimerase
MKVVINGSTGWLGQSVAHAIRKSNIAISPSDLIFTGSKSRKENIGPWDAVHVYGSEDVFELELESSTFVQLAFKTRDYIEKLGKDAYIAANKSILKQSLELLKRSEARHVVLVSSGVVSRYIATSGRLDDTAYTSMKLEEEELFSKLCNDMDSNLVILRLWGATGIDMTEPLKYAVGDLVNQAISCKEIVVSSDHLVYRRYVDSREIMETALRASFSFKKLLLESGGVVTEMGDLAVRVRDLFAPGKQIRRPALKEGEPDMYFSTDTLSELLAADFGIQFSTLDQQLINTRSAVLRASTI